jgi:lipoprotein-anchoring transpeptidase ErfK/SrfK
MAGVIMDKRNWVFLAALVPAMIAAVFGLLPSGHAPHAPNAPAPVAAPAETQAPEAAKPPLLHAPTPKIVPRKARPDFTVKTALQLDGPLRPGDYVWDDSGVAPGHVAIVVDVRNELIYVYRGGHEIGRSTLIYGDDDKPTPIGVFPILEKDADHYSKTYGGAPMPHMLRLTHDGVALHGSGRIDPNYATHGCVGLPKGFAAILFREAKVGDYVKIIRGWDPASE